MTEVVGPTLGSGPGEEEVEEGLDLRVERLEGRGCFG